MNKPQQSGKLPSEVLKLMETNGIQTGGFLYAVTGDMDADGAYTNCWMAFDRMGLYLAFGEEQFVKGKRRLDVQYRLDALKTIPAADIDRLKIEKNVSTAYLIAEKDGEDEIVTRFSIGLHTDFADFITAFNTVKEGGNLETVRQTFHETPFCPKCGRRYPDPERKICPKCMDRHSTSNGYFRSSAATKSRSASLSWPCWSALPLHCSPLRFQRKRCMTRF